MMIVLVHQHLQLTMCSMHAQSRCTAHVQGAVLVVLVCCGGRDEQACLLLITATPKHLLCAHGCLPLRAIHGCEQQLMPAGFVLGWQRDLSLSFW
jgi:hypothetical protein